MGCLAARLKHKAVISHTIKPQQYCTVLVLRLGACAQALQHCIGCHVRPPMRLPQRHVFGSKKPAHRRGRQRKSHLSTALLVPWSTCPFAHTSGNGRVHRCHTRGTFMAASMLGTTAYCCSNMLGTIGTAIGSRAAPQELAELKQHHFPRASLLASKSRCRMTSSAERIREQWSSWAQGSLGIAACVHARDNCMSAVAASVEGGRVHRCCTRG